MLGTQGCDLLRVGVRAWGLGLGVWGFWSILVWGFKSRVKGCRFLFSGLGFKSVRHEGCYDCPAPGCRAKGRGFEVYGLGIKVYPKP